jgi:hypothetical protein
MSWELLTSIDKDPVEVESALEINVYLEASDFAGKDYKTKQLNIKISQNGY